MKQERRTRIVRRLDWFWLHRAAILLGVAILLCLPAASRAAVAVGDFNGDGYADLAVGAADKDVGGIIDAGAVDVIYGSSSGPTAQGRQCWTQNSLPSSDGSEAGDRFGYALAVGDFNGDGYDDLAVGVRKEDVGAIIDAGAVNVIYGAAGGLAAAGNQYWTQNDLPSSDGSGTSDHFGFALAAGDFNNDGYDDLAVGARLENVGDITDAGAVNVIYGPLGAAGDQTWTQNDLSSSDGAEESDIFGSALTVGDFNGDGYADLAVGAHGEDIETASGTMLNAGAVNVIYGSAGGLTAAGNQFWNQDSPGILDQAEPADIFGESDIFGAALAAGDFNNDGYDDLAVGVPEENIETIGALDAGAVNVIYGSSAGLRAGPASDGTGALNQFWHQNSPYIVNTAETGDFFGSALTVGDFNGDGYADLAVGVHGEDIGPIINAGAVNVIYGSSTGLTRVGNQFWHLNRCLPPRAEEGDRFGAALAAGDFNGDGYDDLTVGAPCKTFSGVLHAGLVYVFRGSLKRLTCTKRQFFHDACLPLGEHDHFGGPGCEAD